MDSMQCQLEIPEVKGLEAAQITVGRHVFLKCHGDWNKKFDFSKAQFSIATTSAQQTSPIKIFKVEARDATSFEIDFTFYQAGELSWPQMILTDGVEQIQLGAQKFLIHSVLKKTEEGKPPEPYGAVLPLSLSWPAFYFFMLFGFILTISVLSAVLFWRHRRMKKLISGLKQYESSLEPDLQFYRTLRLLEKQGYPLAEVEKCFKLFVVRAFQVPFFELSIPQALGFFKKRYPQFKKTRASVERLLNDFEIIQNNKTKSDLNNIQELVQKLYRFIDSQETQVVLKQQQAEISKLNRMSSELNP